MGIYVPRLARWLIVPAIIGLGVGVFTGGEDLSSTTVATSWQPKVESLPEPQTMAPGKGDKFKCLPWVCSTEGKVETVPYFPTPEYGWSVPPPRGKTLI